ncbi:MAG TPA: ATP-binding cassette domain-containing protein [Opitutaceae bacterium]|nr:ATP-binding cassette domain-containing protein [Opitutaceae bacterium]
MILRLEKLVLQFGEFRLELSTTLHGRTTGIFGASGSGKTSLLETIAGLRRPRAGLVDLDGIVLLNTEGKFSLPPERRSIAFVPQDGAIFPHLSVARNLRFGFRPRAEHPPVITFEHVTEVLELTPLLDRAPRTLSGGERQRVALGRALLANPKLLLLDEPLVGLDAPLKSRVLPYLIRVRDEFNVPMIYVTHSPEEVMALCDDVLCLEEGKLARQASPAQLFEPSIEPKYQLKR